MRPPTGIRKDITACNKGKCTSLKCHVLSTGLSSWTLWDLFRFLKLFAFIFSSFLSNWVKKCMEYEVKGSRPRGRPKRTWREVVQKACQACKLNREDATDRSSWKNLIKVG